VVIQVKIKYIYATRTEEAKQFQALDFGVIQHLIHIIDLFKDAVII
jgi:hypothetical protein